MKRLSLSAIEIDGLDKLNRTIQMIGKEGSKSVARASMTGAMGPLKKSLRSAVNATSASSAMKRAARATIGSSVKKQAGGSYGAKAGFGVGKPSKKKKMSAHERNVYGQGGAKLARGVGLSAANIHWFVLGTKERHTKAGKHTGKIEPELAGLVPVAVNAARGQMISEAARRAAVALKRELMKRR